MANLAVAQLSISYLVLFVAQLLVNLAKSHLLRFNWGIVLHKFKVILTVCEKKPSVRRWILVFGVVLQKLLLGVFDTQFDTADIALAETSLFLLFVE